MRFYVDELPYYNEDCPFEENCWQCNDKEKCPRHWDKYFVTSDENPHCCNFLFEKGADLDI